jgi:hypothetical protein
MKQDDIDLLNSAFKFLQGNVDAINLGFEILLMYKEELERNPHYYNKLIKHYRKLPSMTNKPNLEEIMSRHVKFAEKLIGKDLIQIVKSRKFGYALNRLMTYFKNLSNDNRTVP